MSKINAIVAGVIAMSAMVASTPAQNHVKGQIIVKFKSSASIEDIEDAVDQFNGKIKKSLHGVGLRIIELPANANEKAHLNAFKNRKDVEFAELDTIYASESTPNDPSFNSQWHLNKISSPQAWDLTTGNPSVIIAILDSGVAGWHSDLTNQMVPAHSFRYFGS